MNLVRVDRVPVQVRDRFHCEGDESERVAVSAAHDVDREIGVAVAVPCFVFDPTVTSYDSMTSWISRPMSHMRMSIPATWDRTIKRWWKVSRVSTSRVEERKNYQGMGTHSDTRVGGVLDCLEELVVCRLKGERERRVHLRASQTNAEVSGMEKDPIM